MKQTRAQEQHFFPWAHEAHGIKLSILAGQLDAARLEILDPRSHALDLSADWHRAQLDLEVQVPTRVAKRVIAEEELGDPPLAVLVALRCDRTRLRRRVGRLDWAQGRAGRFAFGLDLDRAELADKVELDAFLIRARPLEHQAPGVATRVGARLATARAWVLQVDPAPQQSGNYLEVQYRSFVDDPGVPLSQHAALYRLELEREDPILYLNADHEHVRVVLDNKGTRGRRVRARELLYERIEAGVWTQLLIHASARIAEDGELAYAWERAILDQWLARLYPHETDDAARCDALRRDYQQLPRLLTEIDAVIQVHGELAQIATKLVDEL